ncbi:MAG: YbhB/YbcL family Raf kinase inhibitor-like protein [Terriglobia bacterium]|jgi:hypothetical protein
MKSIVAKSARVPARFIRSVSVAIIACVLAAALSASFAAAQAPAKSSAGFKLETSAFKPGGDIPAKFTCEGEDVSPALTWTNPPESDRSSRIASKSFALIVEDPDAPTGDFVHWIVFNLPWTTRGVSEGIAKNRDIIQKNGQKGGIQGRNDFGKAGYNGPCPPPGKAHRYYFRLYALDSMMILEPGYTPTKEEFDRATKEHVIAKAELMGKYQRH